MSVSLTSGIWTTGSPLTSRGHMTPKDGGTGSSLLPDKGRVTMNCHKAEELAVIGSELTVGGFAQARRLFEHRVEHWSEIARRGIDNLQYLCGRGLLRQGLARLGQQPRILHRDDRLRREIL